MKLLDYLQEARPDLDPKSSKVHLARHNGSEFPLDVFIEGEFDPWQGDQSKENFNRDFIVSLIKIYELKELWLFGGVYRVHGCSKDAATGRFIYDTSHLPDFEDLEGRLIVAYSKASKNSYRNAETLAEDVNIDSLLPSRIKDSEDLALRETWGSISLTPTESQSTLPSVWQKAIERMERNKHKPLHMPVGLIASIEAAGPDGMIAFSDYLAEFVKILPESKAWGPFFFMSTLGKRDTNLWTLFKNGHQVSSFQGEKGKPSSNSSLSSQIDSARMESELVAYLRIPEEKARILNYLRDLIEIDRSVPSLDQVDDSKTDLLSLDDLKKLDAEFQLLSPARKRRVVNQVIRNDRKIVQAVKAFFQNKCQFHGCAAEPIVTISKSGKAGLYSEVAHIRAVANGGKSVLENLAVLCPNHHKAVDMGEFEPVSVDQAVLVGVLNGSLVRILLASRMLDSP